MFIEKQLEFFLHRGFSHWDSPREFCEPMESPVINK
jgi:hypothetical protein